MFEGRGGRTDARGRRRLAALLGRLQAPHMADALRGLYILVTGATGGEALTAELVARGRRGRQGRAGARCFR